MRVLEVEKLSYTCNGQAVLHEVSFSVAVGEALGVVSDQPASGHILTRLLIGELTPREGDVRVNGLSVAQHGLAVTRLVSYVPAHPPAVPHLTCHEYLCLFAAGHGVPSSERTELVHNLLELMELRHVAARAVSALPPAMRQRLEMARALAHDPPILVLEDPFAQLDPRASIELRELLKSLVDMGKAILLSGPWAVEIADVCTHLLVLASGRVEWLGPSAAAPAHVSFHRRLLVRFLGEPSLARNIAMAQAGVVDVVLLPAPNSDLIPPSVATVKEMRVHFNGNHLQATQLMRALMHSSVQLLQFGEER